MNNKRNYKRPSARKRSTRKRKTRAEREKEILRNLIIIGVIFLVLVSIIAVLVRKNLKKEKAPDKTVIYSSDAISAYLEPTLDVQLLTPNEFSRPEIASQEIQYVVIHYTANPGSSAQANRDYFENLKNTGTTHVSSHFIVGLDGEIIQCVPTAELAYASNDYNTISVSIECCHPDETGKYNEATYESVVQLTAWLCSMNGISVDHVIRHYDITGKDCPRYFVQNPEEWEAFRSDVQAKLEEASEAAK